MGESLWVSGKETKAMIYTELHLALIKQGEQELELPCWGEGEVLHCVVLGTIQVPSTIICSNKPLLPLCGAGNRTLETSWVLKERTGQHWWLPATIQSLSRGLGDFKQLLESGHKAWDTSSVPKRHVCTSELSTEQLLPMPRAAMPCGDGYTGCTF